MMAKVSQAQEPSMEEILASIRRIISDDGEDAPTAATGASSISTEAIDALFGARTTGEEVQPVPSFLRQDAPTPIAAEPVRKAEPRPAPEPRLQAEPRPRAEQPRVEPVFQRPPLFTPATTAKPEPAPLRPTPEVKRPAAAALPVEEVNTGRQLLSPAADAAVTASFGDLATTLLSGNARTIEDLVKDMLRPMLKAWLDTNLPPLVERLVRDEIERVSRGR
ncbi:hypothetical protein SAMN02745157_3418 [Kaistia soli DSM 19436]|uniref:Cell pole-organizing protein PopZ n=2 Tax=Kaistia TaxID=166953 RepID=A0A1M5GIX7_9HYPH|nr:hypothetical protein SAMN02745157_3418 [Kaistia soli DSM 19436]